MKLILLGMTLMLFGAGVQAQSSMIYEGTLFDSNGTLIEESGVELKVEIRNAADSCVMYRSIHTVDLSNSAGHFSIDVAANPDYNAAQWGTLFSNSNGNSINCEGGGTSDYTGVFAKRKIRLILSKVNGAALTNPVTLPSQDIDMTPYAAQAENSKTVGPNGVDSAAITDNAVTNAKVASGLDATKITTGTLAAGRVQHGGFFIDSAGTLGQVWTSDGAGAGGWGNAGAGDLIATNNLNDVGNVATARTNLGLAIGTDVQAFDADLTDLADGTLTATKVENGQYFIDSAGTSGQVWTSDGAGAGNWAAAASGDLVSTNNLSDVNNAGTARTNLGLAIGTDVQAFDADLTDLADGSLSGSKVGTGIDGSNITTGTVAFARLAGVQASDADLTDLADGSLSGSKVGTGIDGSNITTGTVAFARLAGVQASDADLTDLADGSLSGSKVGTGIDGSNITTGTVAFARLTGVQALDADLTDLADGTLTGSKVGSGIAAGNITAGNLDRPIVQTGSNNAEVGQLTNQGGASADNGDATINFANTNVVTTTFACTGSPTAITLQNLGDAGAYSLVMTGAHSGSCTFTHGGDTTRYPDAATSIDLSSATNGAVITVLKAGSTIFIASVVF